MPQRAYYVLKSIGFRDFSFTKSKKRFTPYTKHFSKGVEPTTLNEIYGFAKSINQTLVNHRRTVHAYAETGFETVKTADYICKTLRSLGLKPNRICKNGIYADIGGESEGKSVLLRCDIDALPIPEKTSLPFKAENGSMHACGHDMHTAMLLGCAEILQKNISAIHGKATLLFQPAEEILMGADAVIKSELTIDKYDAAVTLHVISPSDKTTGNVIVPKGGVDAPSADFFTVTVKGSGCHGSSPWLGKNPISCACSIVTTLDGIKAREVNSDFPFNLVITSISSGDGFNVIPDIAKISGSSRCYDEETRSFVKKRIEEISDACCKAHRCDFEISYKSGCPSLIINKELTDFFEETLKKTLGEAHVFRICEETKNAIKGSEDFAYFSRKLPCFTVAIPAGFNGDEKYKFQMHSSGVLFDEDALPVGAAVYASCAIDFLNH